MDKSTKSRVNLVLKLGVYSLHFIYIYKGQCFYKKKKHIKFVGVPSPAQHLGAYKEWNILVKMFIATQL